MAGCALTAEGWFGPTVQGCRDNFDFTLSFEQCIFTILPASALLIVAPLRIFHLRKLPAVVGGSLLRQLKLAIFVLLAALQLAYCIVWATWSPADSSLRTTATAAASISFMATLFACVLSCYEHSRSLKPSSTLNAYILVSLILDMATLRTIWQSRLPVPIRAVATASFCSKGVILFLEAIEKRRYILDTGHNRSPEETSGIYSQGLFLWMNSLLGNGFRQLLKPTDLFPVEEGMSAAVLDDKFWKTWHRSSKLHKYRIVLLAFTICQPLLLSRFLSHLQSTSEPVNIGYGLVAAYGIVYVGMATSSAFYYNRASRMATILRGMLVSAVYWKTIDTSVTSADESTSVTLMSTDGAMGAWTEKVQRRVAAINQMRADEINAAAPFRLISSLSAIIAQVPVLLAPVATFAFFAVISLRTGQTFEATNVFSYLSFIIILAAPLFGTLEAILTAFSTLACLERIQNYLNKPPHRDRRRMGVLSPTPGHTQGYAVRGPRQDSHSALDDAIELADISARHTSLQQHASDSHDIQLQNASFGWTHDDNFVVKNVNFVAEKSQFVLLAGPVASGKSTLLKGLLGEAPFTSGTVTISRHKISWCDQTPWLTNIIGFSPYIAGLYEKVVYACDLSKDFVQLPDGDETMVGSQGTSLSGGQEQRVAIARAVYSKPHIALFDDVFSGVDNRTANTYVFCQWLIPSSCFGKTGPSRRWAPCKKVSTRPGFTKLFSISEGHTMDDGITGTTDDGTKKPPKKPSEDNQPTDKRRQLGDYAAYGFYFSSLGVTFVVILLALEVFTAFFQTFPSVWLKWWTDASAAEGNHEIGFYLGVYAALQVAGAISFFAITWFVLLKVIEKSGLEMHRRLLHATIRAPLSLFATQDTGSITTKFSQDLGQLDRNLPMGMLVSINSFLVCVAQAVLIASATWYLAISFPILVGVIYCLQKVFLRTSRQLRLLDLEEKALIYTQFIETLAGLTTIRAFSWERCSADLNHELVDRSQKPFYLLLMVQQWLVLVLDLIVAALALLVVGLAVRLWDTVPIGFTGVSLVQLITFAETAKMLIQWWTSLEISIGAVSRIKQFTEDSQDENLPGGRMHKALDDVTISVKAGEKIGIVGRTGSGKSSLLLAILRMLDLSAGSITVDGLDLTTLPREELRSRLITITQDQFFLPGTVRQNIDPYESSTMEDIRAMLLKVGLWDSIEDKGGLDAAFEEEMLSHGQRQLFFLARAILRKAWGRLVLLDEATGSVDQTTEARVQELIREEFCEHTAIAIAHRLETIVDFDRVVVLEKGYVVEQGRPEDLLRSQGPFKQLWSTHSSLKATVRAVPVVEGKAVMPKKRHQPKYSKPPSTAPPSLSFSRGSSSSQTNPDHARSVNDILTDLRRSNVNSTGASHVIPQNAPSVPPNIRHIFQIPDAPAPPPRRPQRRGLNGRRLPPGPPPPRSWLALSQSRHAPSANQHPAASHIQNWPLPDAYYPEDGSLVDLTLRHMATDWVTQRDWNRFYLYTLAGGMRSALLHYVSTLHEAGVSAADMRLVLGGPPRVRVGRIRTGEAGLEQVEQRHFPPGSHRVAPQQQQGEVEVQDSWDAPELLSAPTKLLPNLTHLSLATSPTSTQSASWRQLLILAAKLPTLTHLNLSGWPAPSLTPNAMAAKVVSPITGRAANYGATNHYSHILDDDWSEAVLILRKLSKALYSLVYLDLTGCGDWFPALRKEAEGENSTSSVDWASDWGKIEVLRLCSGYAADPDSAAHLSRLWDWKRQAVVVEKNIRSQRAGRGRFITVEMDKLPDLVESQVAVNAGAAHNN
ncbi:hypothetical protein PG996_009542 [Apiospora saccharicola]|uniref:ABC transporter n=1 Tax=Apiospora saccharicola TaxID=335842 RepID=A0ABR1UL29_9PEZI